MESTSISYTFCRMTVLAITSYTYNCLKFNNVYAWMLVLLLYLYSESEIPRRRFGYNGREDFTVSLLSRPNDADLLVSDLSSITIWCQPFNAYFAQLNNFATALANSTLAVSYIQPLLHCSLLLLYF